MPNADVFISYKREEHDQIAVIADRLHELGLTTWFDARLESGTSFDEEINNEVRSAKCVLVCWTPGAIKSRWVRAEASIGLERDVLAAAFLAPTELMPPYNLVHAQNLQGWDGAHDSPGWQNVLGRIGKLAGRPNLAQEARSKALEARRREKGRDAARIDSEPGVAQRHQDATITPMRASPSHAAQATTNDLAAVASPFKAALAVLLLGPIALLLQRRRILTVLYIGVVVLAGVVLAGIASAQAPTAEELYAAREAAEAAAKEAAGETSSSYEVAVLPTMLSAYFLLNFIFAAVVLTVDLRKRV